MPDAKPTFVNDATAVLPHRVLKPEKPGPHPTVVMIHGYLGNEDVMWVFSQTLPKDWLLVAPRAIVQEKEHSFSWHPRQSGKWPTLEDFDTAVSIIPAIASTIILRLFVQVDAKLFIVETFNYERIVDCKPSANP